MQSAKASWGFVLTIPSFLHMAPRPTNGNGTTLSVKSDADLNRTIDLLRSWGVMIQSISQQKSSLEDTFVKLVTEGSAP